MREQYKLPCATHPQMPLNSMILRNKGLGGFRPRARRVHISQVYKASVILYLPYSEQIPREEENRHFSPSCTTPPTSLPRLTDTQSVRDLRVEPDLDRPKGDQTLF